MGIEKIRFGNPLVCFGCRVSIERFERPNVPLPSRDFQEGEDRSHVPFLSGNVTHIQAEMFC